MHEDRYGLPLTTDGAAAAGHLADAIAAYNNWRADAMEHVGLALAVDPDFPTAHALRGLLLAAAKHVRFAPMIAESLTAAEAGRDRLSPRERAYVVALGQVAVGRPDAATDVLTELLEAHPTDLLAHRMVQQELLWMGRSDDMRTVVERAAPAWSDAVADYSMFLSVRAFSNEETLHFADAERFGRAAVDTDPADPWGAHAVAHTLVMQGRTDDGIAWLESLCGNWTGKNQIAHHLWWHFCLFLLEAGDHDRILEVYDTKVWNPDLPLMQAMPDLYNDLLNAASLLLRLELRGVTVGGRWHALTDTAAARIGNHLNPFTSAHAAVVLAAAGESRRAQDLLASMRDFAARDTGPNGTAMAAIAVPCAEAAVAHRRGDHEAVLAALLPARGAMPALGGSHAQRDVFFQILVDSARKLGSREVLTDVLGDIGRIGFADVANRTLYAEAARPAH